MYMVYRQNIIRLLGIIKIPIYFLYLNSVPPSFVIG